MLELCSGGNMQNCMRKCGPGFELVSVQGSAGQVVLLACSPYLCTLVLLRDCVVWVPHCEPAALTGVVACMEGVMSRHVSHVSIPPSPAPALLAHAMSLSGP